MVKTMREIEKLQKVMDEEDVDHVRVERHCSYNKDTGTKEACFSVGIHKYGYLRNIESDDEE